jgi:serine/threonine protein kinase
MDRIVALKVIRPELVHEREMVDRFRREIRAAARLNHPNIVTAYDADEAGNTHFLVLEYVAGKNLDEAVKGVGRLSVAQASAYARQAALGLQYAFERGMVHRDIKPHNLMLTDNGDVKILDFGLARFVSENALGEVYPALTPEALSPGTTVLWQPSAHTYQRPPAGSTGTVCMGTADYMAPEEPANPRAADIRADIYSLGCTLYRFLAGEVPFPGGGQREKLRRHRYSEAMPLHEVRDDVPRELSLLVARMMAKDPAARPQTPAEVAQALDAVLPAVRPVRGAVLIVEDDPLARENLAIILAGDGYQVAIAANGREALNYLQTNPLPMLILLDLNMPVLDGWQFIQEQRQHPEWAAIPVVVVSAALPEKARAAALGAAEFLQKPVEVERLTRTVQHLAGPALPSGGRKTSD